MWSPSLHRTVFAYCLGSRVKRSESREAGYLARDLVWLVEHTFPCGALNGQPKGILLFVKKDSLLYNPSDFSGPVSNSWGTEWLSPSKWMAQSQSNRDISWINDGVQECSLQLTKGCFAFAWILLSPQSRCPQLSDTNFQVKIEEALGEDGYYLTFISDMVYSVSPWTIHGATIQHSAQATDRKDKWGGGGVGALQDSTPLKVMFGGKLPPVILQSFLFWVDANCCGLRKDNPFL